EGVRRSIDVLEVDCSRSGNVVRSGMNLKQQVVGTFEGEVVGPSVRRGSDTAIG
ncbi:hypothetical protein A2U01_0099291, partial [Trifolium medium]|nr:hypothetical protein [Trifolium medium]